MPRKMEPKDFVLHLINDIARNSWGVAWDNMIEGGELSPQEIEQAADVLASLAAEVSGYASARGAEGTGDHGHDGALLRATRVRQQVRKGLGYSK